MIKTKMSGKTMETIERLRKSLDDAFNRMEVWGCCAARREAEQILRAHPKLRREYNYFVKEYNLDLN